MMASTSTMRTYLDVRSLAMHHPFVTAKGEWSAREVCVVCVEVEGVRGFGEGAPLPGFSVESFEACVEDMRAMCAVLQGRAAPDSVEGVERLMKLAGEDHVPSARFAVEGALLDVAARRRGVAVAELLDASWGAHVAVNATLGARPAPESFSQAMSLKDKGFTCFKIKVGVKPLEQELASVRAVREAVGDAATLRLDANEAWGVDQAIEAIKAFDDRYGITLVEQPVEASDVEGLARVREALGSRGVAIAADEAITDMESLDRVLAARAADVVVLKPMMLGGVLTTRRLMQRAYAHGVKSVVTTSLEGVIGRTLTLHLVASSPAAVYGACGLATGGMLREDLANEPFTTAAGEQVVTSGTQGLGLDVVLSAGAEGGGAGEQASRAHEAKRLPLLQRQARACGASPAVIGGSAHVTYAELYERAARLVSWLTRRGVKRGDRVAMCAQNSVELVVVMHALMAHGVCMVPLHPKLGAEARRAALARVRPALVLGEGEQMIAVAQAIAESSMMSPASQADMSGYAGEDRVMVLFTSGTTGEPKMASLTWSNVLYSAMGSTVRLGHLPGERWGLSLPLCHIGGLSIVLRCLCLGTTAVVWEAFEARRVAEAMVAGEITMWSGVSAMMWMVLEVLGERRPHASFRFALLGGGAVPTSLLDACAQHGVPIATTYGMTETGSQLTTRAPQMHGIDRESAGPALLWSEVRIKGGGEEGELEVRGATLCEGYLGEGLEVLDVGRDGEGWFSTGDWGRVDEQGAVHVLDRRTDLIVTGGENVYPVEIERILAEHDGVQDVCVVGLPDERWGQRVVAVIVPEPWAQSSFNVVGMLATLRDHLASFKVPRQVELWGALPRTELGKLRRAEVRTRLEQSGVRP